MTPRHCPACLVTACEVDCWNCEQPTLPGPLNHSDHVGAGARARSGEQMAAETRWSREEVSA